MLKFETGNLKLGKISLQSSVENIEIRNWEKFPFEEGAGISALSENFYPAHIFWNL